jgi:hypothetical protein
MKLLGHFMVKLSILGPIVAHFLSRTAQSGKCAHHWFEWQQNPDSRQQLMKVIAGVTGNTGQHAARYALKNSHQILGLRRNLSKLTDISLPESSIANSTYCDAAALKNAYPGADSGICAYPCLSKLHLDGQLLYLRGCGTCWIQSFLTASWDHY